VHLPPHRMSLLKLSLQEEVWLPLVYRHLRIERAGRMDLLVEKRVVVELKNVPDTLEIPS
jgi:hypothetical protein